MSPGQVGDGTGTCRAQECFGEKGNEMEWPPKPPKDKKPELSPRIRFSLLCWAAEPWARAVQARPHPPVAFL